MKDIIQRKILSVVIALTFLISGAIPLQAQVVFAQGAAGSLPAASALIGLTAPFTPVLLIGVKVDPQKPFHFEFILDRGDTALRKDALRPEADKLVRYFMAALTIPEKDIWVNLSPYEADRIVPKNLGETDMGRDLLAQDYILKQLTASLVNPEGEWGKKFWDAVYKKAYEQFGTTSVPVDTLNKVWIVPSKAVIVEASEGASIKEARLKVMLEEDYLAFQESQKSKGKNQSELLSASDQRLTAQSSLASQIVREIILPLLEKEVNEGKHFASLRQIYGAIILAAWYKTALKEAVLNRVYSDQGKVQGIDIVDKDAAKKIYDQYVEVFKKGVSAMIRVEYDPVARKNVPRRYFSGGITKFSMLTDPRDPLLERRAGPLSSGPMVSVDLKEPEPSSSAIVFRNVNKETLNELKGAIPGAKVFGFKALAHHDKNGQYQTVFFRNDQRHLSTAKVQFGEQVVKPPYENIFGFEFQLSENPDRRGEYILVGGQLHWAGAGEQKTSWSKIKEAWEAVLENIDIEKLPFFREISFAIEFDSENMKSEGSSLYRIMSTEIQTSYFKKNPAAQERILSEVQDLIESMHYDENNEAQKNKLARVVLHYAALALAFEMVEQGEDPATVERILDLFSGHAVFKEDDPELERIFDQYNSFLARSFADDVQVLLEKAQRYLGKAGPKDSTGRETKARSFIHDFRLFISKAVLILLTGNKENVPDIRPGLLPRILTPAIAGTWPKINGVPAGIAVYDSTRREVIFIPSTKDSGGPKAYPQSEELVRFLSRRQGPFMLFPIQAKEGEKISISLGAILDMIPKEERTLVEYFTYKDVQTAETHILDSIFWKKDSGKTGFLTFRDANVDYRTNEKTRLQKIDLESRKIDVLWFQDPIDVQALFGLAYQKINILVQEEKKSLERRPSLPGSQGSSSPSALSSDRVGGIDFDTQEFLETVRREGTRAIVFSDEFLSQEINGLTPVILQIVD